SRSCCPSRWRASRMVRGGGRATTLLQEPGLHVAYRPVPVELDDVAGIAGDPDAGDPEFERGSAREGDGGDAARLGRRGHRQRPGGATDVDVLLAARMLRAVSR